MRIASNENTERNTPKTNTSKHYFRPKLDEYLKKKKEKNKMDEEPDKTRSKQLNLYFIKRSLDKI